MIAPVLLAYLLRLLPGVVVLVLFLLVLPRKLVEFRLLAYVFLFLLCRDAMTPRGLWGITPDVVIRLSRDPAVLVLLGVVSVAAVFLINFTEPELGRLFVWFKGNAGVGVLSGTAAGFLVAVPVLLYQRTLPPEAQGQSVPRANLVPLFWFCLTGNFLEEALFRGYFQGYLERQVTPLRAALLSGVFFSACHVFLATTVTEVGWPLLVFTLYEGVVAGLVRSRFGVLASTLGHGGAIFLLASGLFAHSRP